MHACAPPLCMLAGMQAACGHASSMWAGHACGMLQAGGHACNMRACMRHAGRQLWQWHSAREVGRVKPSTQSVRDSLPPKKVEREHCDTSSERRLCFCECRGSVYTGTRRYLHASFSSSHRNRGTERRKRRERTVTRAQCFKVRDAAGLSVCEEGGTQGTPRLTCS